MTTVSSDTSNDPQPPDRATQEQEDTSVERETPLATADATLDAGDGDAIEEAGASRTEGVVDQEPTPEAVAGEEDDDEQQSATVAEVLVLDDSQLEHQDTDLEADTDDRNGFPLWLRRCVPADDLAAVLAARDNRVADPSLPERELCEECAKRRAIFCCVECEQRLCFTCCDAIHLLTALATHDLALLPVPALTESPRSTALVTQTTDTSLSTPGSSPPPPPPQPAPIVEAFAPSTQIEHRLHLPVGTPLFFRADDIDARPRALRHGIVVGQDHSVRADHHDTSLSFYYRLVWLRGVEVLPNGFYRATLVLPSPSWPVEIGLYPSQLGAFRAVLTAEKLARAALRRDRVGGRALTHFPSETDLCEIQAATEAVLGQEFRIRLTPTDDASFWRDLSAGRWDLATWLQRIGRGGELAEEAVAMQELADAVQANTDSVELQLLQHWAPANRVRFFALEQHELLLPTAIQHAYVARIIGQMLFTYTGFAWQRWRHFVKRHRRREKLALRHNAVSSLQRWWRRLQERRLAQQSAFASVDALDLYRRRQVQAMQLYKFFESQWIAQLRRAFVEWAADTGVPHQPPQQKREDAAWHPSHGIVDLPRLPKPFAHRAVNGSVAIEDLSRFQQFRAAHAGPTEATYWVLRERVLAGDYPSGQGAFRRSARRMVSRTDDVTSILLQQVGSFVCLAEPTELTKHETTVDTAWLAAAQLQYQRKGSTLVDDAQCQTPWLFERIVRAKHELLRVELAAAVKLHERLEQLARRELDECYSEDAGVRAPLENKLTLAQQGARTARAALQQLAPLQFDLLPIPRDSVPHDDAVLEMYLLKLEQRLRRGERIFVFSIHGHGRTGLVSALLLARLYGLTASDALERAQRLHDCQPLMHGVGPTQLVSSPHAAVQVATVQRLVARTNDAAYARVETDSVDERLVSWRQQQRGTPIEKYATQAGFMVSDRVSDAVQREQSEEMRQLKRVAKRETAAVKLQFARLRERREREEMAREE